MEIKRGPRGYKMVHADVGVCDTIVGQGYTDYSPTDGSRFYQIFL